MGQIYSRTYFPTGYSEWIVKTKLHSEKDKMSKEDYNTYVINQNYRKIITSIYQNYSEAEQKLKTDMNGFLEDKKRQNTHVSNGRIIYDILVGNVFCNFWMKLINQPLETINRYYINNVPNVEDTFRLVEKKYNLGQLYPAQETIDAYNYYA